MGCAGREMAVVKKGTRASTNTKVGDWTGFLARRRHSLREQQQLRDHQAVQHRISHYPLHTNAISIQPSFPTHLDCLAAKHLSSLQIVHLHNRQHGFGGNYDCVCPACELTLYLVLIFFAVSTTVRAAEMATTYLRDGTPKQTPPT